MKKKIVWFLLALLSLIAVITWSIFFKPHQETIKIAIAAPLTHVDQTTAIGGESMVQGARLYLDQINQAGGIKGKKLKLEVYDDQNNPQLAAEVAHKIVNSQALAVIGHYDSNTSLVASKIYQAYGIPAVTGSATADEITKWNTWYFRTVFANSNQGMFIANYIKKILKRSQITIVYTSDSYGMTLADDVATTFTELGGAVVNRWLLDSNSDRAAWDTAPHIGSPSAHRNQIVDNLVAQKERGQDPGIIFIAGEGEEVADIIARIKLYGLDYPIFGGDALADVSLVKKFVDTPEERDNPGFFTNNIYALSPVVFDISGERGQQFRTLYEQRYGTVPGWIAAAYYDAVHLVTSAIAESGNSQARLTETTLNQTNQSESRYLVKEALANLKPTDTTIQNIAEVKHFNSQGDINISPLVGVFDRGKFTSAFTQLQVIPDVKIVDDLEQQLREGKIVKVGSEYMHQTDIVYTGIDVNQVANIDEKTSTYLMDFYLWFRYHARDLNPEELEFSNYGIERLDSGEKLALEDPLEVKQQDGVSYQLFRVKADFKEEFDFRDYPFDTQTLAVRFRHSHLTRDKLIYAVDYIGMRETTIPDILAKWQRGKVFAEVTDWIVNAARFYPDIITNQSTLGDRRLIDTDSQIEYSRFNAVIDIQRDLISFSIKELLPLLFFVVVAYLLLFLPFEYVSVEAVSGLLLAVVFYHLSLIEKLPEGIGYVIALDYAFYLVYGLLGLELLIVTVGHSQWFTKGTIQIKQLMDFGRLIFPTLLLINLALLYWQYS